MISSVSNTNNSLISIIKLSHNHESLKPHATCLKTLCRAKSQEN